MQATVVISRSREEGAPWDFESALAGLCAATPGWRVMLLPHLYHLPAGSPAAQALASLEGPVVLFSWLYPRPAEWLARGRGFSGDGLTAFNLADFTTAEAAHAAAGAALGAGEDPSAPPGALSELAAPTAERWYPVLDTALCRNCQHCLQFCLFGVYELDGEGRVSVTHPDQCKPGCPACSRICPEGAIMFPLYARDEAIAGAPGRRMAPDAAARKMFYLRTRRTCPVCGSTADTPGAGPTETCEECGRALAARKDEIPVTAPSPVAEIIRDDIDSLLDDLDHLSRGNA